MWFRHGLKAQKLLAQGITLGISAISLTPCKGKSLLKKDIKNENKRRIHSPHHISCRRTAKHLRHHLPAPLWFCSKKPAPQWQRCRYLCRNASYVFPDSPSEGILGRTSGLPCRYYPKAPAPQPLPAQRD